MKFILKWIKTRKSFSVETPEESRRNLHKMGGMDLIG